MLVIAPEGPLDGPGIERLLDRVFGLDRFRKASYRYRPGVPPVAELCLVAAEARRLVGSIRFWPVRLAGERCLLLGPLAIDPDRQGRGIGRALVEASLGRARARGWRLVFLVGDAGYYARHGFTAVPPGIAMPGEDPARVQHRALAGASLPAGGGVILRDRPAAGLLGLVPQVGEERAPHERQALVGGDALVHLGEAVGHGAGSTRPAHGAGEGLDQRADGEDDGPGPGQPPQRLPLDPEPQPVAGVLGREVRHGLPLAGVE